MEHDTTCMNAANTMSCAAQVGLAKNELMRNGYLQSYMVDHPACPRFNELMDRGAETALLLTTGSFKKECLPPRQPSDGTGPWTEQFQTLLGEPSPSLFADIEYDKWTKARYLKPVDKSCQ